LPTRAPLPDLFFFPLASTGCFFPPPNDSPQPVPPCEPEDFFFPTFFLYFAGSPFVFLPPGLVGPFPPLFVLLESLFPPFLLLYCCSLFTSLLSLSCSQVFPLFFFFFFFPPPVGFMMIYFLPRTFTNLFLPLLVELDRFFYLCSVPPFR